MATKKKPAKKPAAKPVAPKAQVITIKITPKQQKQLDEAYARMVGAEKKIAAMKAHAAATGEPINKSDLCEQYEIYGDSGRMIITIFPGFSLKIRRIKKGLIIILDAIEANCNMPLPEPM